MRQFKALMMSVAATACALATVEARAQSGGGFDLSWNTIDGGGGTSSGGAFTLSGTIGQPDAGAMSGGSFTLSGGFWALPPAGPGCPTGCSPADVASEGNPDPLSGPDGFVTGVDFDVYIQAFFKELRRPCDDALIADITDGAGTGPPDGFVTGTDFDLFVQLYFAGC